MRWMTGASILFFLFLFHGFQDARGDGMSDTKSGDPARHEGGVEKLPAPDRVGAQALEGLLQRRLSVRQYSGDGLSRREVGQLLWAAGGTTQDQRFLHRTIPSAGALYPLEFYLVERRGVARYDPIEHTLQWSLSGDQRKALASAALGQECVAEAPIVIVIAAVPARTTGKYGARGERYVTMEVGFACQNILLQATALKLGAVPVGAFSDGEVARILELPEDQEALLIVPVGKPK